MSQSEFSPSRYTNLSAMVYTNYASTVGSDGEIRREAAHILANVVLRPSLSAPGG